MNIISILASEILDFDGSVLKLISTCLFLLDLNFLVQLHSLILFRTFGWY